MKNLSLVKDCVHCLVFLLMMCGLGFAQGSSLCGTSCSIANTLSVSITGPSTSNVDTFFTRTIKIEKVSSPSFTMDSVKVVFCKESDVDFWGTAHGYTYNTDGYYEKVLPFSSPMSFVDTLKIINCANSFSNYLVYYKDSATWVFAHCNAANTTKTTLSGDIEILHPKKKIARLCTGSNDTLSIWVINKTNEPIYNLRIDTLYVPRRQFSHAYISIGGDTSFTQGFINLLSTNNNGAVIVYDTLLSVLGRGDTLQIALVYSWACDSMDSPFLDDFMSFTSFKLKYTDFCGVSKVKSPLSVSISFPFSSSSTPVVAINGPADIVENEISNFEASLKANLGSNGLGAEPPLATALRIRVSLPEGIKYAQVLRLPIEYKQRNSPQDTLIRDTLFACTSSDRCYDVDFFLINPFYVYNNRYYPKYEDITVYPDVILDCDSCNLDSVPLAITGGFVNLAISFSLVSSTGSAFDCTSYCEDCAREIGSINMESYFHCLGSCNGQISTLRGPQITRRTLGWDNRDTTNTLFSPKVSQLTSSGVSRVSVSDSINLNAAIPTDTVLFAAQGVKSNLSTGDTLGIEIQFFDLPKGMQEPPNLYFSHVTDTLRIFEAGQEIALPTQGNYIISLQDSNRQYWAWRFWLIYDSTTMHGLDSLAFNGYFTVRDTLWFYGKNTMNQIRFNYYVFHTYFEPSCDAWGDDFEVYRPNFETITNSVITGSVNNLCEFNKSFAVDISENTIDPFPNEFRPVIFVDSVKYFYPKDIGGATSVGLSQLSLGSWNAATLSSQNISLNLGFVTLPSLHTAYDSAIVLNDLRTEDWLGMETVTRYALGINELRRMRCIAPPDTVRYDSIAIYYKRYTPFATAQIVHPEKTQLRLNIPQTRIVVIQNQNIGSCDSAVISIRLDNSVATNTLPYLQVTDNLNNTIPISNNLLTRDVADTSIYKVNTTIGINRSLILDLKLGLRDCDGDTLRIITGWNCKKGPFLYCPTDTIFVPLSLQQAYFNAIPRDTILYSLCSDSIEFQFVFQNQSSACMKAFSFASSNPNSNFFISQNNYSQNTFYNLQLEPGDSLNFTYKAFIPTCASKIDTQKIVFRGIKYCGDTLSREFEFIPPLRSSLPMPDIVNTDSITYDSLNCGTIFSLNLPVILRDSALYSIHLPNNVGIYSSNLPFTQAALGNDSTKYSWAINQTTALTLTVNLLQPTQDTCLLIPFPNAYNSIQRYCDSCMLADVQQWMDTLKVCCKVCNPAFSSSDTVVCVGEQVHFSAVEPGMWYVDTVLIPNADSLNFTYAFLTPGNHSVIHTVEDSCDYHQSILVLPLPALQFQILVNNQVVTGDTVYGCDSSTVVKIIVSGANLYSWGSDTLTLQGPWVYGQNYCYSVQGISAETNCSITDSVCFTFLQDCNCGAKLLTDSIANTSLNGGFYYVPANTTITVDTPVTWTGVQIVWGHNSTLYLQPQTPRNTTNYTLQLNNCHLYGCDTTWNGIVLGNLARIYAKSNTLIEDALVAITIDSNSHTNRIILNCDTVIFNKNQIGIMIKNYTHQFDSSYHAYKYYIKNCVFTSRDLTSISPVTVAQLKTYNSSIDTIAFPYTVLASLPPVTNRPFEFGIYLDSIGSRRTTNKTYRNYIQIGDDKDTLYTNIFDYANTCIYLKNASASFQNNVFHPRNSNNLKPFNMAIYGNNPYYKIQVLSTNIYIYACDNHYFRMGTSKEFRKSNRFYECDIAVKICNYSEILSNYAHYMGSNPQREYTGIIVRDFRRGVPTTINNNRMVGITMGINVSYNYLNSLPSIQTSQISGNNIIDYDTLSKVVNGIILGSTLSNLNAVRNINYWTIEENNIQSNASGINISMMNNVICEKNTVRITPTNPNILFQTGISIYLCKNINIYRNQVKGHAGNKEHHAIYCSQNQQQDICSNTVDSVTFGFTFFQNNVPTTWRTNTMKPGITKGGMYLWNSGEIGHQFALNQYKTLSLANYWEGDSTAWKNKATFVNGSVPKESRLYLYAPTNSVPNATNNYFTNYAPYYNPNSPTTQIYHGSIFAGNFYNDSSLFLANFKIANNCNKGVQSSSQSLVEIAIGNRSYPSLEEQHDVERHLFEYLLFNPKIRTQDYRLDSFYVASLVQHPERTYVYASDTLMYYHQEVMSNPDPSDAWLENLYAYFQILKRMNEQSMTVEDSMQLRYWAGECYANVGEVSVRARNLFNHLYYEWIPEQCETNLPQFKTEMISTEVSDTSSQSVPLQVKVYPNPFDDKLIIRTNAAVWYYELWNSMGHKLMTGNAITNEIELNLSEYANGMYFIKIQNHKEYATIKIVKRD